MFDESAAKRAAQRVIAAAPVIEGGAGNEIAINVKELVSEIVAAGNPNAAVIPAYDEVTAASARFWVKLPSNDGPDEDPGVYMILLAHKGAVGIGLYTGDGKHISTGLVGPEFAWHLGMAACSASQESKRLAEEPAEVRS
jgi:hypothetical protein